jgi:hypothetical protein
MIVSAVTKNPKKAAGLTGIGAVLGASGLLGDADDKIKKLSDRRAARDARTKAAGTGGR